MKKFDILAATLLIVGGLNWGLVAVAEFDLVATIVGLEFGETNLASRVIYGLVGLAVRMRRRLGLILEPGRAVLPEPLPPLVSGLASDAEPTAPLRDVRPLGQRRQKHLLVHRSHLSGHGLSVRGPGSGVSDVPRHHLSAISREKTDTDRDATTPIATRDLA